MSDMKKLLDSLTEMATVSGSVATVSAPLGATQTRSKSTGTPSVYGEQVSETESVEKTDECDTDSDREDGVTNNVRTPANFGLWQNSYHQAEEQKKQSKTKKSGAKKPVSEARLSDEMSELDKPEIQSAMKRMKAKYDSDPRTQDQEKFSRDLGRRLQAAASRSEKKLRSDEQLNDNRGPGGLRPLNLAEQNLDEADLIMNPFERSKKRPRGIFSKNTKQDHEVSMARSDLLQCIKNSEMVIDLLSSMSDSDNIEAWVQEKIVKANDYLNTVAEYLEGKRALGEGEDLAWDDPDLVMMRKMQADKKKKMAVVKPKDEIGFKVSDIGPGGREHNVKTDAAWDRKHGVKESVTDYNPKSQGGTRKELLAKLRSAKSAEERSELATRARKAGATQKELQDLSEGDGQYGGQYDSKEEAVAYAKERVKSFRDPEDGIEIWAMPGGGFDVVHTMNSNGRNHVVKNGGKKLGTVGQRYKGVAEGSDDELNARPGMWRGDAKRMTAKGKPTKDELGMQDNLKNRIKASNKKGGLTGPKGVLPEQGVAEGNDQSDIRPARVGDEIVLKNSKYRGVIVKLGTDGEFSFKNESDGKRYRGNTVMIDRNLSQENRYRERSDTDNKRFDDAMARDMERIDKSGALKKFGIGEEIEGGVAEAFGENLPPLKSPNKDDPYEQGWRTFYRRGDESDNPYERGTPEYKQWNRGFQDGEAEPNHYDESVNVAEKGPGLWANIHAKRERIKKGSGERMRKPGSKGAPSAKDLKSAQTPDKKS